MNGHRKCENQEVSKWKGVPDVTGFGWAGKGDFLQLLVAVAILK